MPTVNPGITGVVAVGQVPYTNLNHTSGPQVVLGSNNLWWEASTSRFAVGLNGTAPSAKVHVLGDGAPAAQPLALRVDTYPSFFGDIALSTYTSEAVFHEVCPPATSARVRSLRVAPGNLTALSGGELNDVVFDLSHTVQFGTGTLLSGQRAFWVRSPTYSATSAKTMTSTATLYVEAPVKGTNVTWGAFATYDVRAVFAAVFTGSGGLHVNITGVNGFVPGPGLVSCYSAGIATNVPAGTEYTSLLWTADNSTAVVTWNGAPGGTQRWVQFVGPALAGSSGTVGTAATVAITNAPVAAGGISITSALSLWVQAGTSLFDGNLTVSSSATFRATTINANTAGATLLLGNSILAIDQTNLRVGVNSTSPDRVLDVRGSFSGGIVQGVTNTNSAGYSAVLFRNDGVVAQGSVGYGNASISGDTFRAGRMFIGLNAADLTIVDAGTKYMAFYRRSDGFSSIGDTNSPAAMFEIRQGVATTGSPIAFKVTGAAHTTLSNAEASDVFLSLARTVQFGQNTLLATQRAVQITAPTYSSSAATKTITDAVTVDITAAPTQGTNVILTNAYALRVQAGETRLLGGLRVTGNMGFFGAAAVAQQTVGAVTNSVTAGGVDGTIANYTDLTTYATDAATIRNNIYQLARSVAQLATALRNLGLGA